MSGAEIPDLLLSIWKRWKTVSPVERGQVTQEQYWILRTLNLAGAQRLKDLAERIGCTPSSASIAVKRLERSDMVSRERKKEDEREVLVSLTETGRRQLAEWRRSQLKGLSRVFDRLTVGERDQLKLLLLKVAEPEPAAVRRRGRND